MDDIAEWHVESLLASSKARLKNAKDVHLPWKNVRDQKRMTRLQPDIYKLYLSFSLRTNRCWQNFKCKYFQCSWLTEGAGYSHWRVPSSSWIFPSLSLSQMEISAVFSTVLDEVTANREFNKGFSSVAIEGHSFLKELIQGAELGSSGSVQGTALAQDSGFFRINLCFRQKSMKRWKH